MCLRDDAQLIIDESIKNVLPYNVVKEALHGKTFSSGKVIIVSIGKAAYLMAKAASETIKYDHGIVITKYKHLQEPLNNFELFEAGHPIVDENSLNATSRVLELTSNLNENDTVVFLISGGGSALFEKPVITLEKLKEVNNKLLKSKANINEINTIRKRLSLVKGGKFAKHCSPAKVYSLVLSDIINDPLDMIASGPAYVDSSSSKDALDIVNKYHLDFDEEIINCLKTENISELNNVETKIIGNVSKLCNAAKDKAEQLGYKTIVLKEDEQREAKEASIEFAKKALEISNSEHVPTCLIMGGETVVEVKGNGLGGRNQEFALVASKYIKDKKILIFSLGSDGTDGPTDAAGGIVCGKTISKFEELNINVDDYIDNNDSYHALSKIDSLIITGPTGTNVNDLMVALIK